MSAETWYVLEDGTAADPREVSPGKDGILRHKDGRAVEYRPHGPRSRGVDPDEERKKSKPPAKGREAEPKANRQMKAEGGRGYKTRNL